MIEPHAFAILVGALAFAFVLIGAGVVHLQNGISAVNKRLEKMEATREGR